MEVEKSHFAHIAKMATKLDSIPEGNGSMLDNTLIVYVSCSGGAHHDGQLDWPFVLVGGMARKLKMGQYIEYPKYKDEGHRTIVQPLPLLDAGGGDERSQDLWAARRQSQAPEPDRAAGRVDGGLDKTNWRHKAQ
jgi:hypothetical protein